MGEAARRKAEDAKLIWHHTSILRTNRIWMSGVIEVEGKSPGIEHPAFGEVFTSATARRALIDFPPLVWMTSQIAVPKCLRHFELYGKDRDTGEVKVIDLNPEAADAFALNRVALGFAKEEIAAVPWPDHYGYETGEGRDLNATARDVGDNPDEWWVADQPIDVMLIKAFRSSSTILSAKLERRDEYIADIRRMVQMCRSNPSAVIPPTWVGTAAHHALIKNGGDRTKWGALASAMQKELISPARLPRT